MAGIYLHIPFCKKACHYCDFHFSTQFDTLDKTVEAMCLELEWKKHLIPNTIIDTVYFGGGTPSAIPTLYIERLLDKINNLFSINSNAEITLEANPDDLSRNKIKEIFSTGINRLSIGIQSFHDEDLKWMNRAHNALDAKNCLQFSKEIGFDNLSIDLIYGFTLLSDEKWLHNIEQVLEFEIPHISCYQLTVEPKTALAKQIQKGISTAPNDIQSVAQMHFLIAKLQQHQYEHYEISNFALPNKYAVHNTNYWKNLPYLGIGPSAHSYIKPQRMWNISHNRKYIDTILNMNQIPETLESLTPEEQFNEKIMTSLRTQWGIDLKAIEIEFGEKLSLYFQKTAQQFIQKEWLLNDHQTFKLTSEGKTYADYIASEFFITL